MTASVVTSEVFRGTGKRERILRAAVDVFAQTGYFSAKVSDVAKAAGVADGTIYLYFQGKEDLLLTIFREYMTHYLGRLQETLAGVSDLVAQLREAVTFHLTTAGSDRALAVVFQVELRQSLKFMSLLSQGGVGNYLGMLKQLIERGQVSGVFRRDLKPQVVANAIFGILDEMVTKWILSEKDYDLAEDAEQVTEFILRGLL